MFIDSVVLDVSKSELFEMAQRGEIGPDTPIQSGDTETTAGKVKGIVFGQKLPVAVIPPPPPQDQSVCVTCGTAIARNTKFCPECGTSSLNYPSAMSPQIVTGFPSPMDNYSPHLFYCSACGNQLIGTAVICPACGSPVQNPQAIIIGQPSKSRLVYILLALFLFGPLGSHNFYAARYARAIIQLVVGLTIYGLVVTACWCIFDAITVTTDGYDNPMV